MNHEAHEDRRFGDFADALRQVAAVATTCALLSMAGCASGASESPTHGSGVGIHACDPKTPEAPQDGNQEVSAELQECLRAATVEIGIVTDSGVEPFCTASKVAIDGKSYVLTARHCMADYATGSQNDGGSPSVQGNFIIMNPAQPTPDRVREPPMGRVTAAAIDPNPSQGADYSLLEVESNPDAPTPFDAIPALDISNLALQPLQPGTPMYLYGLPQANNNFAPEGTDGIYLGRLHVPNDPMNAENARTLSYAYHLVAIRRNASGSYALCTPGASGSNGIASDGRILGALTYSVPVEGDAVASERQYLERLTGRDLSKEWVVCAYSAAQPDSITTLLRLMRPVAS